MYNHFNQEAWKANSMTGSEGNVTNQGNVMSRMDETSAVALLQHLEKTDLQHLLNDDNKLVDHLNDLHQVRSLHLDHDDLIARNKSLAEYNLSLKPRLDSLKSEVAAAYERANSLKSDLMEHKSRLDTFAGQQKLDTMYALLQTEVAKAEEESEQLADKFSEKNLSVEDFLAQYLPKRTTAHLRRIKAEKMGELLRDGPSVNGPASWTGHSSGIPLGPTPYPLGSTGHIPYPLGGTGFSMPQPQFYRP